MRSVKIFNVLMLCAYFTYSALAIVSFEHFGRLFDNPVQLLRGEATAAMDEQYRDALIHQSYARGAIGALRYAAFAQGRDGVVVGKGQWLFSQEEFRLPLSAEGVDKIVSEILRIQLQLAKHDQQLILLVIPQKREIHADFVKGPIPVFVGREFAQRLKTRGVNAFDLSELFAAQPQAFLKTDTHWTPETANAVAQALAQAVPEARGVMEYQSSQVTPFEFWGDLTRFVTTARFAERLGFSPERVAHVELNFPEAPLTLFEASAPPAHALVGTSYSADPNWGFATALQLAFDHDLLNFAQKGRGPFLPMWDYLAQKDDAQFVFWEFPLRYFTDPQLLAQLEGHL